MCSRTLACARERLLAERGREGGGAKERGKRRARGRERGRVDTVAAEWGEEEAGIRFSNRRYISTINIFVTYRFSAVGTFAYAFRKSFIKYAAGNLRLSLATAL